MNWIAKYGKWLVMIRRFGSKQRTWTVVIAVSTTIYSIVAYCQLSQTREALIITQRPWMLVTGASPIRSYTNNKPDMIIQFTVTGNSPVFKLSMLAIATQEPKGKCPPMLFPMNKPLEGSYSVHGPGGPYTLTLSEARITEGEVKAIENSPNVVCIFGLGTYEDMFGEFHATRFCLLSNKPEAPVHPFTLCKSGNDAN